MYLDSSKVHKICFQAHRAGRKWTWGQVEAAQPWVLLAEIRGASRAPNVSADARELPDVAMSATRLPRNKRNAGNSNSGGRNRIGALVSRSHASITLPLFQGHLRDWGNFVNNAQARGKGKNVPAELGKAAPGGTRGRGKIWDADGGHCVKGGQMKFPGEKVSRWVIGKKKDVVTLSNLDGNVKRYDLEAELTDT